MKLNKKIVIVFVCILLLNTCFCSKIYADEKPTIDVNGKSAVLMEQTTGKILMEKNPHEKLAPASITKIMTLILIFEAIENGKIGLDDTVTISEYAASMGGSQVWLEPNENQSVRDLIKCIAIASANDGAVAMAEYVSGSEELFVEAMNKKAALLGMSDTTFKNACGLDVSGHVTSAYDIALMSRELITKHPQIFEYTTIWQDTIIHKTKRGESEFGLNNTNKLLKWYSYANGLKTGSTNSALYCMSGTAKKDGMQLIGVVMGAPDFKTRFLEVIKLFEFGFSNYGMIQGEPQGKEIGQVQVYKGNKEYVSAVVKESVSMLVNKATKQVTSTKMDLCNIAKAPINQNAKLGELIYYSNNEEIGRVDLVAKESVTKANMKIMLEKIIGSCFK